MKRLLPLASVALALAVLSSAAARPFSPAKAFLNSITFADSTQEDPNAPDITTVVVSNDDSGLITFQINVGNRPQLTQDMEVDIVLDTDQNPSTGDPQLLGADYYIVLIPGHVGMFMWDATSNTYINAPFQTSLISSYPITGPMIKLNSSDIGNSTGFNFAVAVISGITVDASGNPDYSNLHIDLAPDRGHGFWNYPIKISPPPPPLLPTKLTASVGPGATISLKTASGARLTALKAGSYVITVHDRSSKDDFHLIGPGVNRVTRVDAVGTAVWRVKLISGVYRYRSDAHPALKGTFTIKAA